MSMGVGRLNVYLKKTANLLEWGGGAACRSSSWPTKIDRSHDLKRIDIARNRSILSRFGHICTVIWTMANGHFAKQFSR